MAIAQRPYPELLPRPAARPSRNPAPAPRPLRAGSRIAIGPFLRPMLVASGLTVALVTYISGYAQMTSAGYQRVRLQAQQRSLQAQQQVLHSELILHRTRDEIQAWAAAHGFVHVSGEQYVAATGALKSAPESEASLGRAYDSSAGRLPRSTGLQSGAPSDITHGAIAQR